MSASFKLTAACCIFIFVGCSSAHLGNICQVAICDGREFVLSLTSPAKLNQKEAVQLAEEGFAIFFVPPEFIHERILAEVPLGNWAEISILSNEWRGLYICATPDEIAAVTKLVEHYDVEIHEKWFDLKHLHNVDGLLVKLNTACQRYLCYIEYEETSKHILVRTSCRIMPEVSRLIGEHNARHSDY